MVERMRRKSMKKEGQEVELDCKRKDVYETLYSNAKEKELRIKVKAE